MKITEVLQQCMQWDLLVCFYKLTLIWSTSSQLKNLLLHRAIIEKKRQKYFSVCIVDKNVTLHAKGLKRSI